MVFAIIKVAGKFIIKVMVKIFEKHQLVIGKVIVLQIPFVLDQMGVDTTAAVDRFYEQGQLVIVFGVLMGKGELMGSEKLMGLSFIPAFSNKGRGCNNRFYIVLGEKGCIDCQGK